MGAHWPGTLILVAYLIVGSLYAAGTPIWQAPDEPAHYNYIRSLAEGRGFPVMEPGDYDQAYISRLTTEAFPPEMSVLSLEYEDHQPPLYYLLAVPIYWVSGGSVLSLRLFSLMLGGAAVAMVFLILREFCPTQLGIAWFGGGLVAFIPQYVAMMASVNNDALVMVLLWLWLWLALRYLRGHASALSLGVVAGGLLLTKSTAYGVIPLALLAVYFHYRRAGMSLRWAGRQLAMILVPALLLGGLWWGRNVTVYGWPDLMGLIRHNEVVFGQPQTADWIARDGVVSFLRNAIWTTFRSFWGQFGWMGVVLDLRIYQGLAIFSSLTIYGALWRLLDAVQAGVEVRQREALALVGSSALINFGMFVAYNLTFVQHQGRYLFPALPLLALGAALGWERLAEPKLAVGTSLALLMIVLGIGVVGSIQGEIALWPIAMLGSAGLALPTLAFAPRRRRSVFATGWLLAMVALDLWCLFGFIIPMLSS
jgi:4-amino-4-deoxy-L-arabinose transferase-like glycosyltransferase